MPAAHHRRARTKDGQRASVVFAVCLPEDEANEMMILADENNISWSLWIREAVQAKLNSDLKQGSKPRRRM